MPLGRPCVGIVPQTHHLSRLMADELLPSQPPEVLPPEDFLGAEVSFFAGAAAFLAGAADFLPNRACTRRPEVTVWAGILAE